MKKLNKIDKDIATELTESEKIACDACGLEEQGIRGVWLRSQSLPIFTVIKCECGRNMSSFTPQKGGTSALKIDLKDAETF